MPNRPENILATWLSKLNIKVSAGLINYQLKTHPDYPSLLSITDTLDYLSIENAAVQIEKDQLHEVDTPFLAHLKTNGGEFVIVENRDTIEQIYPGFYENWTGVAVVIEKNNEWIHHENTEWLKREKEEADRRNLYIISVLFIAVAAIAFTQGLIIPSLLLIGTAGVFVSWLIVSKEMGIENKIVAQVCGKQEDCDAVIHSRGAKLPGGFTFSDVGVIWFASLLISVILSVYANSSSGLILLLSILSIAAVPFTFFSIYYQWKVAKKWCRLCLVTVGLLWAQVAVLATPLLTDSLASLKVSDTFFFSSVVLLVGIGWVYMKKLLQQNRRQEKDLLKAAQFKRNESIFNALLKGQRRVDVTPWENDLQLGNPDAALQIMVACNPYCGPCASTHDRLHTLLSNYQDKIGLTVRFTVDAKNATDKRTAAVQYMLQKIIHETGDMTVLEKAAYSRELTHDWFKQMNFEQFSATNPLPKQTDVNDLLIDHEKWMKESNIAFTPTIFLNGSEMPKEYSIDELPNFIVSLTASEEIIIDENILQPV